ncbi:MAG TPA: DUF6159 family protein [Aggregatilineales bacterium]|nr:hypothetical protein [Anaerolineae bacterium]HUN06381.1 DUF6159 family protein [Aggregatilineales bacterium]
MFERFNRSWELVKASWAVLRQDKELLIFPIVSFLGSIVVLITFAIPMIAAGVFDSMASRGSDDIGFFGLVVGFLFYLVMYTVVIFSNTALVGAAMIRLDGGNPTLADGFRIARERLGIIVAYAAISATVGMILRAISERGGLIGQIASSILGFAWSVLTFLVIPVLVMEKVGPVDAIKRSGELLKQTWGEQLAANFGMGMIFGLATFGIAIVGMVLIAAFAAIDAGVLVAIAVIAMILAIIALSLVGSALGGIYQAALYRYATSGTVDSHFSPETIQGAFAQKPKRGMF